MPAAVGSGCACAGGVLSFSRCACVSGGRWKRVAPEPRPLAGVWQLCAAVTGPFGFRVVLLCHVHSECLNTLN